MITITDMKEVLEITFNFTFLMLAITAFILVYSDKKIKQRSLTDREVEEEMNTSLALFYDKLNYIVAFVPFVFPILYYNTNLISLNVVLIWVCVSPWIWCAFSFTNFQKMIHHALRVVGEDKFQTT